jgi:hypothetical protein
MKDADALFMVGRSSSGKQRRNDPSAAVRRQEYRRVFVPA